MKTFTKRIVINFIHIGFGAFLLFLITQVSSFSQIHSVAVTKFFTEKIPSATALGFGTPQNPFSNSGMGSRTEKNKTI